MTERHWQMELGANPADGGVRFRVWAPGHQRVEVQLADAAGALHALQPEGDGYFAGTVPGIGPGARYRYRLDGGDAFPDPASRSQPEGVHGPSEVVDPDAYAWGDQDWGGRTLEELVVYEAHVGTATPQGTFDALVERLDHLVELGVTALELMPVANFPGERNWGYDGVNLFAPARAYGGHQALKRLVDAAHERGLAVLLDVVYNHLGPEGNYLHAVTSGRFFTDRHKTPWGDAVNFDGPGSDAVRHFVLQNVLHWIHEYHVDGLRLDATHALVDDRDPHILEEIARAAHGAVDRPITLIAEDERNQRRLVLAEPEGYGLDGVWADDFHHQLRRLIAGDSQGYYQSYGGTTEQLVETLEKGWFFEGQRAAHKGRPRGTPAAGIEPQRFVHCIQNHDQVGNRALGERLNHDVAPGVYRAASALLLFTPYTPLLWMGQEWAASSPFLYFTDHPEELGRLVTEGRREEFRHFDAFRDPDARERIPDPQSPDTFQRSKLRWGELEEPEHAGVLALHRRLLRLRREEPALRYRARDGFQAIRLGEGSLALRRRAPGGAREMLLVVDFRGELRTNLQSDPRTASRDTLWCHLLSTEDARYGGRGGWGRYEPDGTLHLMGPGAVVLYEERREQRR